MKRGDRHLVGIDLETGGFIPGRAGILAIGAYWRETEVGLAGARPYHEFRVLVEREPETVVHPAAARKNGWVSDEQWLALGAVPLREALGLLEKWLVLLTGRLNTDKLEPVAHNHASVDRPFLEFWAFRCGLEDVLFGDEGLLSHAWHDSMLTLRAAQVAGLVPAEGGASLDAMLKHMGRRREVGRAGAHPYQVLHDACEDAKLCFDGYHWLTELMRAGRRSA